MGGRGTGQVVQHWERGDFFVPREDPNMEVVQYKLTRNRDGQGIMELSRLSEKHSSHFLGLTISYILVFFADSNICFWFSGCHFA